MDDRPKTPVIIGMIGLCVFFIWCTFFPYNPNIKWFREHETNLAYKGVIVRKYIDTKDHGNCKFVLKDENVYYFQNYHIYNIAEAGDSMLKQSGTLRRTLKKKDTTINYYPVTEDKEVRDK